MIENAVACFETRFVNEREHTVILEAGASGHYLEWLNRAVSRPWKNLLDIVALVKKGIYVIALTIGSDKPGYVYRLS